MVFATLLSFLGLGIALWLLITLAIYALPTFVGLTAGLYAVEAGIGALGAILIGFAVAIATLVLGQALVASVRSPWLQASIAAIYAIPAAIAGYAALHELSGIGFQTAIVRSTFGILGALIVGATAWVRMRDFFGDATPDGDPGAANMAVQRPRTVRDGFSRHDLSRYRHQRFR